MNEREQRIREWAYRLWEQDGRPHGRDGEHWFRAIEIIIKEDAQPMPDGASPPPEAPAKRRRVASKPAGGDTAAPAAPAAVKASKPKAAAKAGTKAGAESPPKVAEAPPKPAATGRRKKS